MHIDDKNKLVLNLDDKIEQNRTVLFDEIIKTIQKEGLSQTKVQRIESLIRQSDADIRELIRSDL